MAYEKQTWTTGEVITETKLNHMEDGIAGGGGLVVAFHFDENDELFHCINKTAEEILQAYIGGQNVIFKDADYNNEAGTLTIAYKDEGYAFYIGGNAETYWLFFVAENGTDLPVQYGDK